MNYPYVVKSTKVVETEGNIRIEFPTISQALFNCDTILVQIAQDIPVLEEPVNVVFKINDKVIRVTTRFGNKLKSDQLSKCRVYKIGLGTENPNFTMLSRIPKSSILFPVIVTPTECEEKAEKKVGKKE